MKKTVITHAPHLLKDGPNVLQQAANLAKSLAVWTGSGFQTASEVVQIEREKSCLACEFWDSAGNAGLGKCRHMSCGCTRAKWQLATSECPLTPPKWTRTDN